DGKTNQPVVSLQTAQKMAEANGVRVQQTLVPAQNDGPETHLFTAQNSSPQERWLYLNWEVAWPGERDANRLRYWSGKGEPVGGAALRQTPPSEASLNT